MGALTLDITNCGDLTALTQCFIDDFVPGIEVGFCWAERFHELCRCSSEKMRVCAEAKKTERVCADAKKTERPVRIGLQLVTYVEVDSLSRLATDHAPIMRALMLAENERCRIEFTEKAMKNINK